VTPEQAFAELLRSEPSRPFVTYYDEASGERTELSAKSLANWVAKTHHLLIADLDLGVGDTALVAIQAHWIAYPVLLGCLTAGLALTAGGSTNDFDAAVAFVDPDHLNVVQDVPDSYAVSPGSAAVGFRDTPPDGTSDYVTAVRPQQDKWVSVHLAGTDADPCLPDATRGEVMVRARTRADELGLRRAARLLSTADWTGPDPWLDALLVPMAIGGSVVLVRNASEKTLTRRAEQERVDLVL
jgi:uncharacterized protein (TIGR03089 family)